MKKLRRGRGERLTTPLICAVLIFSPIFSDASITPDLVNGSFNIVVPPGSEVPPVAVPWEVANGTPELVVVGSEPANNTGMPWLRSPDGGSFAKLNGTFDPVFREAIQQSIDGFVVGQTYQLEFYLANTGFYFPLVDTWHDTPGYIEIYIDDVLVGESIVVPAPASQTDPISWSSDIVTFVASFETHVLRFEAVTIAAQGSIPSRNTTAYMNIDGVRLTSEICDNGIDDDFDGLVDDDDPDCAGPPSVHGIKWQDDNGNGQRDPMEQGLAGVIIYSDLNFNSALDQDEPSIVTSDDDPQTTFNESGLYHLTDLAPGDNRIREVVPAGYEQRFPAVGFHDVTIAAGQSLSGIDFGNWPETVTSLHGLKWLDQNGNGARETAEPGLAGVTIYLDLNDNGTLEPGEPTTLSMEDDPGTTFNEIGLYWFMGLEPNTYSVREVVPDGFSQTFPATGFHQVSVAAGESAEGLDFGNLTTASASLSGMKWQDDNGNGMRDTAEPGLPGVTIYIDLNGNLVLDDGEPTTATLEDDSATAFNEAGLYFFSGLEAGLYSVREITPLGFVQTFPGTGSHEVELVQAQSIDGLDFGNQPSSTASIHGLKWRDNNNDGARDTNEPGLPGVTIFIDLNLNEAYEQGEPTSLTMQDDPATSVNEAGMYWITGLERGDFSIREIVPPGFTQTFPPSGAHDATLTSGQTIQGLDFGNWTSASASLLGFKWHDSNRNGVREASEPGIAGVTVYLDRNNNGRKNSRDPTTLTLADNPATLLDETGLYRFTDLEPGSYNVREVIPDGFDQTFPDSGVHQVVVASGESLQGLDFGNWPRATASLHGIKWHDSNGDSVRDASEPGIPGVTVYLDRNNNQRPNRRDPSTLTMQDDPATSLNEAGMYWFTGLEPGTYNIREVIPEGYAQTFPLAGAHQATVVSGQAVQDLDFGNWPRATASLHGLKWRDVNRDGVRDPSEPGLPGVTIYLDRNNNQRLNNRDPFTVTMQDDPATLVNEAGMYWFTDLEPGSYNVREVIPEGFDQTFPLAGVHQATVNSGEAVQDLDFGNWPRATASLHGIKWEDLNGNGARDNSEPGIAGVTIYLDRNDNQKLNRREPRIVTMQDDPATLINEAGMYWFTALEPGTYNIREVIPDGFTQTFPSAEVHRVAVQSGQSIEGLDFGNQSN